MPYIFPTAEELAPLVEELGLDEPEDLDRLAVFIGLVSYHDSDTDSDEYLRANLWRWIVQEQELYYGQHDSPADFARYFHENYGETELPNWIRVDWQGSWDSNLRHDFYFDDGSGYVWADIY